MNTLSSNTSSVSRSFSDALSLNTESSNTDTNTKNTSANYNDYYHNFSMDTLLTEIFGEHLDDRLNAYIACCGRHVRDGRGDMTSLVH